MAVQELISPEELTESNLLDTTRNLLLAFKDLADKVSTRDMKIMDNVLVAQQETNHQLGNLTKEFHGYRKESNQRLDKIETRLEGIDTRLEGIDTHLEGVEGSIKQMKDSVVKEQQETNSLLRELIKK